MKTAQTKVKMMKTKLSEKSKDKAMSETPLQKIGLAEFLKGKRQEKNLTLEHLSDLTKIQLYHLEALEMGQFEKLPPSIYRDGIFKRLSKFLDANEGEIIKAYKNEFKSSVKAALPEPVSAVKKRSYFILTPGKFIIFLSGLLLVILFGYLWYQFNFLIGPPNLAVIPGEDAITAEDAVLIRGKTDNGIDLTINGENTYVDSSGNFEKNVKLAAGLNVIEIQAVNNFGKITKIVRQIFRN